MTVLDFHLIWRMLPDFLVATLTTVHLTLLSISLGTTLALVLALMSLSGSRILTRVARLYIFLFRGTPLLAQLFVIYYALPQTVFGITLEPYSAALVALGLNTAAYISEVFRAGLLSVPRGQIEAGRSLGMSSGQAFRRIILPQALRLIVPPFGNEFIALVKDSSLASTITLVELTQESRLYYSRTFKPIECFMLAAAIYLAVNIALTRFFLYLERKTRYD